MFSAGLAKLFSTCLTKRRSEVNFEHFCDFVLKKNRKVVKIAFYVSKSSLWELFFRIQRNTFGPLSVNFRRIVKTQSFMSDGSNLKIKLFENFAGFKQIFFPEVCKNCFLSALIRRGAKTFLKLRRNIVGMYFLEYFPQFELKIFGKLIIIFFLRVQSFYSGKIFRFLPEIPPDVARKVSSRVVKTASFRVSIPTSWENFFSEFTRLFLGLCERKYFNQKPELSLFCVPGGTFW